MSLPGSSTQSAISREKREGCPREVEKVEEKEAPRAPSRDPKDHRRGEGDHGGAVDIWAPLLVPRHPQQLQKIEAVVGQRESRWEQPHRGVPDGRLKQRIPFQAEDD